MRVSLRGRLTRWPVRVGRGPVQVKGLVRLGRDRCRTVPWPGDGGDTDGKRPGHAEEARLVARDGRRLGSAHWPPPGQQPDGGAPLSERRHGVLTVEDLRHRVDHGEVDTVLVAFTDMQGRLQGKRLHARYFLDVVLEHATEGCNYLLAVDVDMNTVEGYAMSSWSSGYGDFVMQPDLSTLRRVARNPGTAMGLADLRWGGTE